MTALITPDLVRLDVALGDDSPAVIRAMAGVVQSAGRATDEAQLVEDALAREATSSTGLPGGIAIPHCRTAGVAEPTLAFARLSPGVDFGAKDGPADLAFLIAAPAGGDTTHLQLLTKLARALVKPAFTSALRAATSAQEVVGLVSDAVGEAPTQAAPAAPAPSPAATPEPEVATNGPRRLVGVTACPTGIAHTYMAAEAL
ncbi:MAG TPA: fructose PTS transporter subunit IIA, partial [Nocardioides sp.]|nr:fructose PTS transporter subunit IIA [Nocardioides sp.]